MNPEKEQGQNSSRVKDVLLAKNKGLFSKEWRESVDTVVVTDNRKNLLLECLAELAC